MRPPDEITIFYYLFWSVILGAFIIGAVIVSVFVAWIVGNIVGH